MKNTKKIAVALTALLFCSTFSVFLNSSAIAEPELPVYTEGNQLWEKEFFLGSWCQPSATDEDYQTYKDAGFNAMYIDNSAVYNTPTFKAALDKCAKYELKAISMQGANSRSPVSIKAQSQSLENHPAYYGVMMCDEPQGDGTTYAPVKACVTTKRGADGNLQYTEQHDNIFKYMYSEYEYLKANQKHYNNAKYCSVVLNEGPAVGSFGYGCTKGYGEVVLKNMDPEYRAVEFDKYPYLVLKDGTFSMYQDSLWFQMHMADFCKQYNVGKRVYYYQQYWPTEMRQFITVQELTYQLYTAMAFGVNGFVAWMYQSNWDDYNALDYGYTMSVWGAREYYLYNQQALTEIKNFDHIYLEFADNWLGVMPVVGSENSEANFMGFNLLTGNSVFTSYEGIENVTASQDTLIGVMKDSQDRTGYMITNQAYTFRRKSDKVKVKFNGATKALVVEKGVTKAVELVNGVYETEIGCGSGVFVIPV